MLLAAKHQRPHEGGAEALGSHRFYRIRDAFRKVPGGLGHCACSQPPRNAVDICLWKKLPKIGKPVGRACSWESEDVPMKPKLLRLHPQDNVVIATAAIKAGTTLRLDRIKLQVISNVPMAGKVATRPIAEGEKIIKLGHPIGHATRNIEPGEWVHTHNLASDYLPTPERAPARAAPEQVETAVPVPAGQDLTKLSSEVTEGLEPTADLALTEETSEQPQTTMEESNAVGNAGESVCAPPAGESLTASGEAIPEGASESDGTPERPGDGSG